MITVAMVAAFFVGLVTGTHVVAPFLAWRRWQIQVRPLSAFERERWESETLQKEES